MKVYLLDIQERSNRQLSQWLYEDKRVNLSMVFEDYTQLIKMTEMLTPDICMIRLGDDRIPGIKVANMIKEINSEIKIIFISNDREYALNAYEIGAYGYLLSPVKKEKLQNYLMSKNDNEGESLKN